MTPRTPTPPPDDDHPEGDPELGDPAPEGAQAPDLSALPVAGITRRRLGFLAGALVSAWIVIVFARQVGEASAASARVEDLREANAALAGRLAALERESDLIQRQAWIEQQARAYQLGTGGEIPFALGDAEPLPADAPGSASVRLGADAETRTPLESWLSLLFGPSR
jgi:cell division protein FtsB